jgi:hypothetical protein
VSHEWAEARAESMGLKARESGDSRGSNQYLEYRGSGFGSAEMIDKLVAAWWRGWDRAEATSGTVSANSDSAQPDPAHRALEEPARLKAGEVLAVVVFVAVGGWALWWSIGAEYVLRSFTNSTDDRLQKLGQIGDLFGGINSLFAALAFAGVAFAAYLQHRNILLQAEQLKEARLQAAAAQAQLTMAEEGSRRQAFEPLFFRLLELNRDRADKLNLGPYATELRQETAALLRMHLSVDGTVKTRALLEQRFERFYLQNEAALGPYYRTLYHTFNLVKNSKLLVETKVQYANIARATLSADELFLLSLDVLTSYGKGFKTLVEHFGILKHGRRTPPKPTVDEEVATLFFDPLATMNFEERLAAMGLDLKTGSTGTAGV